MQVIPVGGRSTGMRGGCFDMHSRWAGSISYLVREVKATN
jgi:hypothetical protein